MQRPMLAAKATGQLDKVQLPAYLSPKIDGVRGQPAASGVYSRSLKLFPNKRLQLMYTKPVLFGFDGEFVVGNPWDKNVCDVTRGHLACINGPCNADFYVFDLYDHKGTFEDRQAELELRFAHPAMPSNVHRVRHRLVRTIEELLRYEEECLNAGFEGIIGRSPNGLYKFNRSTLKEGGMWKLKRFEDSEAEIIGMEQFMHNANVAIKDERGFTKRQTLQENMVPMDTMGALWLKDLYSGVVFKCGTGYSAEQRKWFWDNLKLTGEVVPEPNPDPLYAPELIPLVEASGLIVKYQHFPIGRKNKPRHSGYLGLRDRMDM